MVIDSSHWLGHHIEPTSTALEPGPRAAWWRDLPAPLRSLSWPGALAAISILGLLLAFHQVVSGSVRQGELRRAATVMQSEATWRCNALASLRLRDGCLVQLSAAPHDEAALRARSVGGGE